VSGALPVDGPARALVGVSSRIAAATKKRPTDAGRGASIQFPRRNEDGSILPGRGRCAYAILPPSGRPGWGRSTRALGCARLSRGPGGQRDGQFRQFPFFMIGQNSANSSPVREYLLDVLPGLDTRKLSEIGSFTLANWSAARG
jgi:hypothetical protein